MYPPDLQKLFKRKFPPCGKFSFINNVWLHYVELIPENYVSAETKTIVMIHGLSGSMHDYLLSPMMSDLKKRYRIICIDRPGAGYSYITIEKQFTLEDQIEVIKDLLKQLNVVSPIIVGHSLGGTLALSFAALNPDYDAKYLLLAPLLYPVWLMYIPFLFLLNINFIRWIVFRIILIVQTLFFHQFIKNAFRPNADLLTTDYEEITKDQLSTWIQLKAEFNNLRTVRKTLEDNSDLHKTINKPISVLIGKSDKIIPAVIQAEKLFSENSSVEIKCLSRIGHMVNFACTKEIIEEINANSIS
jgi:pimeloyl-ACP methyl ester carboxylesterase